MSELLQAVETVFPNRSSLLFNKSGRYNSVFITSPGGPPAKEVQRKLRAKGFDVEVSKHRNKYGIHEFDNHVS